MQQVSDWLEKLGLGQYAQRFAENGIVSQDLEKIGVLLGHRRKMLAAIAQLAATTPASLELAAPRTEPKLQGFSPTGDRTPDPSAFPGVPVTKAGLRFTDVQVPILRSFNVAVGWLKGASSYIES